MSPTTRPTQCRNPRRSPHRVCDPNGTSADAPCLPQGSALLQPSPRQNGGNPPVAAALYRTKASRPAETDRVVPVAAGVALRPASPVVLRFERWVGGRVALRLVPRLARYVVASRKVAANRRTGAASESPERLRSRPEVGSSYGAPVWVDRRVELRDQGPATLDERVDCTGLALRCRTSAP